ncbi:Hypothetical_protein [Hexamita inflata]|uniref:Hypothetical_protein n=1 Tax=Hexamita inflata TaxID=28002 RepID=A0AA86QQD5_9EUKA|nr:Hypothetical protein HINF_LOCUS49933 [Hexamita inflata]CAI9971998.1 Hypothetical protein HINF_LOCUS59643 [Hexamita inflata]
MFVKNSVYLRVQARVLLRSFSISSTCAGLCCIYVSQSNMAKLRRDARKALPVHDYQSYFTNSSIDSTTVSGWNFKLFSGQPSQNYIRRWFQAVLSRAFGIQKQFPQLWRAQFLRTMTHYNFEFRSRIVIRGLTQLLHQNVHRLEYFECCEVRPIQLQRRADLKSFSHYLQLVFEIYL